MGPLLVSSWVANMESVKEGALTKMYKPKRLAMYHFSIIHLTLNNTPGVTVSSVKNT